MSATESATTIPTTTSQEEHWEKEKEQENEKERQREREGEETKEQSKSFAHTESEPSLDRSSEDDDDDEEEEEGEEEDGGAKSRLKHRKRMRKYQHWEQKYGFRVVAYVNSKSGGRAGKEVLRKLRKYIPANQVHDLFEEFQGVEHTLPQHLQDLQAEHCKLGSKAKAIRVLACGGDGTVGWVASSMATLDLEDMPDMALLPLGTGNDLAKVLRWGRYFDTIEKFHAKHFVKRVFTAKKKSLDRWKFRIITEDVKNRDQLSMTMPPQLRRTVSMADDEKEVDEQLVKFKFDSQKMDYVKNVQTAERIAAQWFEDRKMYRSLQGMHNMTYSDWKRAYSDTTGIGLVQNSLGPPPNVAGVFPGVPGSGPVVDFVIREQRMRDRAAACLGSDAFLQRSHRGKVQIGLRLPSTIGVARMVSVDEILALRNSERALTSGFDEEDDEALELPESASKIADNPDSASIDKRPPSTHIAGSKLDQNVGLHFSADEMPPGGGSSKVHINTQTDGEDTVTTQSPAPTNGNARINRTKPGPTETANVQTTTLDRGAGDDAGLDAGVQSIHQTGNSETPSSAHINRTKPGQGSMAGVVLAAHNHVEATHNASRGNTEAKVGSEAYVSGRQTGTLAPKNRTHIARTKPASRVSLSSAWGDVWHLSGAGIGVDDHEYDPLQNGASGPVASSTEMKTADRQPATRSSDGKPKARQRSTSRKLAASHFRSWKTGTLLNYFHVGLGARLVYEFESERRYAPQKFKSREANNRMYAVKWLRACCLSCKETLECRQCRRLPRNDEESGGADGEPDEDGPKSTPFNRANASQLQTDGGRKHGREMVQTEYGFVESVTTKIKLKIRPPPPPGSPPGTCMPFVNLDLSGRHLAEIAFVNIGSFGGGRLRTDHASYSESFVKQHGGVPVNIGDGIIEIIGFRSLTHICCALGGVTNAVVLGQATEVLLYANKNEELYMGVDGEPFKASGADGQGIDFVIHFAPDITIPMLRPS